MADDRLKAFEQRTLLQEVSGDNSSDQWDEEDEGEGRRRIEEGVERVKDLEWLMRRMSRLASYEAGHSPKESIKVWLHQSDNYLPRWFPPL